MDKSQYLKDFLKRQKLKRQEFADLIGVTHAGVSHWVTGVREIPEPVFRVLQFFDDFELDFRKFNE